MIIKILFLCDRDKAQVNFDPTLEGYEHVEQKFDITQVTTYEDFKKEMNNDYFSLVVTIEESDDVLFSKWPKMFTENPNYIKAKWLNFYDYPKHNLHSLADNLTLFYAKVVQHRFSDFFSIITPTYHTKRHVIERTYESLCNQTCKDWQWIIVDDSKDESKSVAIKSLAQQDFRIKYYNFQHEGRIGEVKRKGFYLAEGDYLLELDHDDILMPNALERVKSCFEKYKDAGFVYSDCAEVNINKFDEIVGFRNYARNSKGEGTTGSWGYSNTGYGVEFNYNGYSVLANVSPFVNPQSIRHITSCPNHLRCWKKDVYQKIGGHSADAHIADDYELMVNTFLNTKFVHLNSVEYVQFYEVDGEENTQYQRNKEIQRLTNYFSAVYDTKIHERVLELGCDDFCWDEQQKHSIYWDDYGVVDEKYKLNYTFKVDEN